MTPYYTEPGITFYHADCRDLLPSLLPAESIITDPIWPNCQRAFPDVDAWLLFGQAARLFPAVAERIVVHLGCSSDPRFLNGLPMALPFLRVCWLEYVRCSYNGRLLNGSDIAYIFGKPPRPQPGQILMSGKCLATRADRGTILKNHRLAEHGDTGDFHPTPRNLQHLRWLVKWYGGASVIDPFMGAGTTALACKELGIPFTGIEIEERYCQIAIARLAQSVLPLEAPLAC
jgi:hypothetical protein